MNRGNIQPQTFGQAHHKPLVDHRMAVVVVRVVRLQNMGGGGAASGFKQRLVLKHDGELMLCAGQRHAFDRGVGERRLGKLTDTFFERVVGQGAQAFIARYLGFRQKQGDRARGFSAVPGE